MGQHDMTVGRPRVLAVPGKPAARLLLILDKKPEAESRAALLAMLGTWRFRPLVTFVTGPSARALAETTAGLRQDIYNAGARESVPLRELWDWLDWREMWVLDKGVLLPFAPQGKEIKIRKVT